MKPRREHLPVCSSGQLAEKEFILTVFAVQQNLLRCSMHGIVYAPGTGKSPGTMSMAG